MSGWVIVGVGIAAGFGSQLRYGFEVTFARLRERRLAPADELERVAFPWAVLAVNVIGSFLVGCVVTASANGALAENWATVLAVGLAGGFTTFSTWMLDGVVLANARRWGLAVTMVCAHLIAGLVAVALGYALTTALA